MDKFNLENFSRTKEWVEGKMWWTLVNEASTMGWAPGHWPVLFSIESPSTGKTVVFRKAYEMSKEYGVVYFPQNTDDTVLPVRVKVFND